MTEWLRKIRKNGNFQPTFIQVPAQVEFNSKSGTTLSFDMEPLPAVRTCAAVNRCNKRLNSSTESRKKQRVLNFVQGNSLKKTSKRRATVDLMHVKKGGSRTHHCNVCGDRGHNQYKCKRLHTDFGVFPLANKDKLARKTLIVKILSIQSLPGYPIFQRQINDIRPIIDEFPKKVAALVMHRRFLINAYLTGHHKECNTCVECTIVRENYTMGPKYLFEPNVIVTHIVKSQTNVIVNCLSTIN